MYGQQETLADIMIRRNTKKMLKRLFWEEVNYSTIFALHWAVWNITAGRKARMTVVTSLGTEESGVIPLQGRRRFSSPCVQTDSGFHRRACPMGMENRSSGKAFGACD